jgi:DNA-binding protein Fis
MANDSLAETAREPSVYFSAPSIEDGVVDVAQLVRQMLAAGKKDIYRKVEVEVDRAILQAVLRYTKGNQVQASELLGISRTTLRLKLRHVRIEIEKQILVKPG